MNDAVPPGELAPSPWSRWRDDRRAALAAADRTRTIRALDTLGPRGTLDGRAVVSFASNDYLGLSAHPAVLRAAHEALDRWGTGSGASRLVVGARPVHRDLEVALAEWKHAEASLVLPSGYATNTGVLAALGGPDLVICSDELNHASIVDGCRLSRAEVVVYPHGDLEALDAALGATRAPRRIVVSDTVFSMDGDRADLAGLAGVARRHRALLVLDEAHAVLGPDLDEVDDLRDLDVLRIGTLSKALGSLGGFVVADRAWTELLVSLVRPGIYSTALPPADAAAALAALEVRTGSEGAALVARLAALLRCLDPVATTPIVPFVLGTEHAALAAADALARRGLLVPAIRPPTVPAGTSRLRVCVSAAHSDDEMGALVTALDDLGLTPGVPAPA